MTESSPDTFYAATARPAPARPPLVGDLETEVCIVGAGFAGLWTARELLLRGQEVVLLDARAVGDEATGRNGGFVSAGYAERLERISARVGLGHARELYKLSRDGVDSVRRFAEEHEPKLDLKWGRLNVLRYNDEAGVNEYAEMLASDYDHEIDVWSRRKVHTALRSNRYYQGLHEPGAFHLDPLQLAQTLAAEVERLGGKIYENSSVVEADLDGLRKSILTEKGRVRAFHVVLAGSAFLGKAFPRLAATVLPVRTDVAVTEKLGDDLHKVIRFEGAIADTRRAGNYYRIVGDRLLWGGRITTRTRQPKNLARAMAGDIARVYPQLSDVKVEYAWSGTMGYAVHKMPQIGMVQPGVWVTSAFGGHGLNTTAMAGEIVASAIAEQDDRWQLFIPFGLVWAGAATGRVATQATYWSMRSKDWLDEVRAKRGDQAEADIADGLSPSLAAHIARRAKKRFVESSVGKASARIARRVQSQWSAVKSVAARLGRLIYSVWSAIGAILVPTIWFIAGIIGFVAWIVGKGMDLIAAAIGVVLLAIARVSVAAWRNVVLPLSRLIAERTKWAWEKSRIGSSRFARVAKAGVTSGWKVTKIHAAKLGLAAREGADRGAKKSAASAKLFWVKQGIPALTWIGEQANLAGKKTKTGSVKLLENARKSSNSAGAWSLKQPGVIWDRWVLPSAKQAATRVKEFRANTTEAVRPRLEQKSNEPTPADTEVKQLAAEITETLSTKDNTPVISQVASEPGTVTEPDIPAKPARKKRKPKEKSVEA